MQQPGQNPESEKEGQQILLAFSFFKATISKTEAIMRAMTVPASNEQQLYSVHQHVYNVHLAHGKWSVHIDTTSGRGRFYGPLQNEGTIRLFGKVVVQADCYLPHQVIHALVEGGFDCGAVKAV